MKFRVAVRILPRAGLLDPQGQAVAAALAALDFPEVSQAHVGKAIDLEVSAPTAVEAKARARAMCDRLLANPVTEEYSVEVSPA